MSTLAEIEAAVPDLSRKELEHLEAVLQGLRQQRAARERQTPTDLSKFAGVLRLSEDPLDWQHRMRQEWE